MFPKFKFYIAIYCECYKSKVLGTRITAAALCEDEWFLSHNECAEHDLMNVLLLLSLSYFIKDNEGSAVAGQESSIHNYWVNTGKDKYCMVLLICGI